MALTPKAMWSSGAVGARSLDLRVDAASRELPSISMIFVWRWDISARSGMPAFRLSTISSAAARFSTDAGPPPGASDIGLTSMDMLGARRSPAPSIAYSAKGA
jgi:hypothetical protein